MDRDDVQSYGFRCLLLGMAVGCFLTLAVVSVPSWWWMLAALPLTLGLFMYVKGGAIALTEQQDRARVR
jgi:hypothetical protein